MSILRMALPKRTPIFGKRSVTEKDVREYTREAEETRQAPGVRIDVVSLDSYTWSGGGRIGMNGRRGSRYCRASSRTAGDG